MNKYQKVRVQSAEKALVAKEPKRRYALDELVALCDPNAPFAPDERWLSAPRMGGELI